MKKLIYLCLLVIPSIAMEHARSDQITLIASSGKEFPVDKDVIVSLSPVIKGFATDPLGQTQNTISFNNISAQVMSFLVNAVNVINPHRKVLCQNTDQELEFYPFKLIKEPLEKLWQEKVVNYLSKANAIKKACQLPVISSDRYKGELLAAALFFEIQPLANFVAFKVAQDVKNKNIKDINKLNYRDWLTSAYLGIFNRNALDLIDYQITLAQKNIEEYTVADYISENGQPALKMLGNKTKLDLSNKKLTSLFGLGCIYDSKKTVVLGLNDNFLVNLSSDAFNKYLKLKELELKDNSIKYIGENTFYELPNLESINLTGNNLSKIPQLLFIKNINLKIARINKNKIDKIPKFLFKNAKNIEEIELSDNKITNIPCGIFNGLPKLRNINLSANQIYFIASGAFQDTPNITYFNLQDNKITYMNPDIFMGFSKVNKVILFLQKNPLAKRHFGYFEEMQRLIRALNRDRNEQARIFVGF